MSRDNVNTSALSVVASANTRKDATSTPFSSNTKLPVNEPVFKSLVETPVIVYGIVEPDATLRVLKVIVNGDPSLTVAVLAVSIYNGSFPVPCSLSDCRVLNPGVGTLTLLPDAR